jgi:signal transduction histidine kinase/ActR/RegA family two-component response regulator
MQTTANAPSSASAAEPALDGEMAHAIAAFPWQAHPLGEPKTWPSSLRNAVMLLLECKLPMYLAWGSELTQFYNDAYRPILGDKHTEALGRSARDTWREIWPTIGPMWDEVLNGKSIGFDDYKLTIERYGYPEDCYFNFSYSPVRDDDGHVAGVFVTFAETTSKVLGERRYKFLDDLAQATRHINAPEEVMSTTSRMLGQYLGVNRCAYAHVLDDENTFDLIGDYNDGVQSIVGQYKFTDFGVPVSNLMKANQPYVNDNVDTHALTKGTDLSAYRLTAIQAVICLPLHKNGRFVAAMAVHQATPRGWTRNEIELVQTVVDRCWESLERIRAEQARLQLLNSERAAREEAERANSVKDNFLATLSHELRTPLTAITGWVHILRKKLSPEQVEIHKGVDVIERCTKAQIRLIDDLLDMSKIGSGKLNLDLQPLDPAASVRTACEMMMTQAQIAGVHLSAHIEAVQAVLGDASRLQQVVCNLLVNAIKFTPRGGKVSVSVNNDGADVVITVSDTGIGISKDFLPHMFERFRQADGTITRKYGGLGLGLSIVQHLVQLHGGTVSAHSEGDCLGSSFTVALPAYRGEANAPDVKTADSIEIDLSGKRILVVDDEEDILELLRTILQDSGAHVIAVSDAHSAMAQVASKRPEIICCDIGMPTIDGYEFIKWLRQRSDVQGGRTPVIAMTAFARQQDRIRSLASGFDMHLSKPIEPAEVLAAVSVALSRDARP